MPRRAKPRQPSAIPDEQWDMPATYSADGSRMATLRELMDPNVPTQSLSQLDRDHLAKLVAKRIELQPKFELMMVGAGPIDRKRAITEVKAQSEIGRVLMEIEQRTIAMLEQNAAPPSPPGRSARPSRKKAGQRSSRSRSGKKKR